MNIILGCILLGISFMANAEEDFSMDVANNVTRFEVTLAANPTTGFQWTLVEYDKNLLTFTDSKFERPDTKLIGSAGAMVFVFTLNKGKTYPKMTKILFKYARSWEKDTGKEQTVIVNFVNPS